MRKHDWPIIALLGGFLLLQGCAFAAIGAALEVGAQVVKKGVQAGEDSIKKKSPLERYKEGEKLPPKAQTKLQEISTIKKAQQSLNTWGYQPQLSVDGVMGLKTHTAIKKFQSSNNLPVTGELDQATRQKLGI